VLQPLQLTNVSLRYPDEIVELRDFLVKAGCEVRTGQALGGIARRLQQDRAFHRDLTSYVWVVIDRCERISYPDLLGVLAIAAAGSSFAAAAEEDDAHRLLRFLMEARHSLDRISISDDEGRVSGRAAAGAVASPSSEPLVARGDGADVLAEPLELAGLSSAAKAEDSGRRRRWLPWVIAAGCVLVAVVIGLWMKTRTAEYAGTPVVSVAPAVAGNAASTPVTRDSVTPSDIGPDESEARAGVRSGIPRRSARVAPLSPVARSSGRTSMAAPAVPSPARSEPPPVTTAATHGPAPAEALPAPAPVTRSPQISSTASAPAPGSGVRAVGPGSSAQANPARTSGRVMKVPSLGEDSAQQSAEDSTPTSNGPVLHRRRPPGALAPVTDYGTELASKGSAPAVPAAIGGSPNPSVGATPGGTVHATSLGTMASNLMYSPVPVYPAAASAAHVQGEVKLSADVDRNGNVASVRVISGPPMLRDAAMDAVQRWRFRPYQSSGRPIPVAAVAVIDFQLP
jgi:TonB family protein